MRLILFVFSLLVVGNAFAVEYIPYIGGGFVTNNTAVSGSEQSTEISGKNTHYREEICNNGNDCDSITQGSGWLYNKTINTSASKALALDVHSGMQIRFGNFYIAPEVAGQLSQTQNITRNNLMTPQQRTLDGTITKYDNYVNHAWVTKNHDSTYVFLYDKIQQSDIITSIKPIFDLKLKFGYILQKWNFGIFGGVNYLQINYKPFGTADYLLPNSDPIPDDYSVKMQSIFKQNQSGFYPMFGLNMGYQITKNLEIMGEYNHTFIGSSHSTNTIPTDSYPVYYITRNTTSFSFSQFKILLNYYWQ